MTKQADGLIEILLDNNAEFGDRQDAAMDLSAFDELAVEQALAQIACDGAVDEDLADSCGESLAEIWVRRNRIDQSVLAKLVPASLRIAIATLRTSSPALADEAEKILRAL